VSRIGKLPVSIPQGVTVDIKDSIVSVKGPKGQDAVKYNQELKVVKKDDQILVTRSDDSKNQMALHGLTRVLIANTIEGVTKGFEKILEIQGVGYSAEMKGISILINVGYSHPVLFTPSKDVKIEIPKNMVIKISGINKQIVGQVAAKIRDIRRPEPYKGKGIRYQNEYVRRKAGKKVGAA